ncbi:Predicted transcriptional regulator [Pantoea agglomerans]|uniref:Predicted transcriptional regulator n=1 Tax=Enterobacter agglomerans TaxID=549 RepID=A0A379AD84_ENTAG|nr:Predicted transcriptional regulator [Pantoea agglomerans]
MKTQNTKLMRLPAVIERTGFSRSWIYELINQKAVSSTYQDWLSCGGIY